MQRLKLPASLQPSEVQYTLLAAVLVGILGALATLAFREAIDFLQRLLFGHGGDIVQTAASLAWWQRLFYPTLGGLLAGIVLQYSQRFQQAPVVADYMEDVSLGRGRIGARLSLAKAGPSALSIASGSSIGREGSMVQLAALTGSLFSRLFRIPTARMRLLTACGAAAGLATAYNAPIAGALFVGEIVLRSIAVDSLGPLLVASVTAHLTDHHFLGMEAVYHMPPLQGDLNGPAAISYALLGLSAGFLAPAFLALLDLGKRAFSLLPTAPILRLGLGGLAVGAISIASPEAWGNGYSTVDAILQGGWAVPALLLILGCKVAATSASTGSGTVGGIFTPTLFVGAVIGALYGGGAQALWPGASPLAQYTAVSMGAFLAATIHAPLTAVLMIFEMTGSYLMVPPLILACVLGYFVSRVIRPKSVYAHALPATGGLGELTANDLLHTDPPIVRASASVAELEGMFRDRRWQHVYVVDESGRFLGAVSLHDFRPYLETHGRTANNVPKELIRTNYPRTAIHAALAKVLETFADHSGERLPVVSADDTLLGYVCKSDLMRVLQEKAGAM